MLAVAVGVRFKTIKVERSMARRPNSRPAQAEIDGVEAAIADLETTVKFMVTDYTIEFLAGKVRDEEYYVPNYQRELVWNEEVQSRFIESILMGLPIPFIFLWQSPDGRLEIVDGSQRLRTIVRFMSDELKLVKLQLLPAANGFYFSDLIRSRQRKFNSRVLRGIVLDNSVSEATRTEMFNRINTGGTRANEAEIRRGALPGPFTDLVQECAENNEFINLTPISEQLVKEREREELVVRFFTFVERIYVENNNIILPHWNDRPKEYIYEFVKNANETASRDGNYLLRLKQEFEATIRFVRDAFPHGFRKSAAGTQIPRVRFEAIAVGAALALRERAIPAAHAAAHMQWVEGEEFQKRTTSDAANVRAKVLGRIGFVRDRLLEI